ncbi:MAG: hypothetical protein JEZ00_20950 [Anaerolineaceae bacterium]|nr:hypothetical protein [Anaerolineaceae bacterium]
MSFEIVEKILSQHPGAKFFKADLHIHTPASKDWDEHNTPEHHSDKITPEQIVQASIDVGLELISITDHNSVEWCEDIINAAKDTGLVVLPGFELSVNPGVHLLAIFPSNKPIAELRILLNTLGINDFGNANVMTEENIIDPSSNYKIVRDLQNAGAVIIPAHIDLGSGIVGRLRAGDAVKRFFLDTQCSIVEIGRAIPDFMVLELRDDPKKFAILKGSDSHTLADIGKRAIWIKMDKPNIVGISQLAFEPLGRLCKFEINNKKRLS